MKKNKKKLLSINLISHSKSKVKSVHSQTFRELSIQFHSQSAARWNAKTFGRVSRQAKDGIDPKTKWLFKFSVLLFFMVYYIIISFLFHHKWINHAVTSVYRFMTSPRNIRLTMSAGTMVNFLFIFVAWFGLVWI